MLKCWNIIISDYITISFCGAQHIFPNDSGLIKTTQKPSSTLAERWPEGACSSWYSEKWGKMVSRALGGPRSPSTNLVIRVRLRHLPAFADAGCWPDRKGCSSAQRSKTMGFKGELDRLKKFCVCPNTWPSFPSSPISSQKKGVALSSRYPVYRLVNSLTIKGLVWTVHALAWFSKNRCSNYSWNYDFIILVFGCCK